MSNPNLNINKEGLNIAEAEFENNIRPREIEDFAGQPQLIENLRIFIKAYCILICYFRTYIIAAG